MMKWVLAAGIVLAMPVAASAQDAEAGAGVFKKCAACHQIGPEAKNALGPSLTCVDGRKVGTFEGFNYSAAVKDGSAAVDAALKGGVWDDAHLLLWMEADDKVIPGNKMIFPAGVKDETDRANLLAYIKSQCAK
jgi:cytochrome c